MQQILQLRVLDPAMGSGAFLVAACRYLAAAAERSLIQEGRWHPGEITATERADLRREIVQRCVFGVDVNPMAVQLARLSLWLATLASDKPLTFLDHRLVAGDSLVGASLDDMRRQPSRGHRRHRRPASLPLFADTNLAPTLEHAVRTRLQLALQPDDSPAVVAEKAETLAALHAPESPLGRWSAMLDLWCAGWFWEDGRPPSTAVFGELCDRLLHRPAALPDRLTHRYPRPCDRIGFTGTVSSTGRWPSRKSSRTSKETRSPIRASTRSSAIPRGTCCAVTAARQTFEGRPKASCAPRVRFHSRGGRVSRSKADRTSTAISCSSSARCS